ncbi:MAG: hypothetical protein WD534_12030 [Phycisphaeraceae bacterium]
MCLPRLSLLSVGLLALIGCSTTPEPQPPADAGIRWTPDNAAWRAEQRMWEQLQQPVTLTFEKTPAGEALAAWKEQVGVNMIVEWTELENAGVTEDTPIRLNLADVPAHVVLTEMLRQISSDFEPVEFDIHGRMIVVSTENGVSRRVVTRTYDIRRLLAVPAEFDAESELQLGPVDEEQGGLFFSGPPKEEVDLQEERLEQLTELIRRRAGRIDHWDEYGGDRASLDEAGSGHLIIEAAPSVHRDVRELLDMLATAEPRPVAIDAWVLSMPTPMVDRLRAANANAPAVLDARQLDRLLSAVHDDAHRVALLATVRTTLLDGQRGHLSTLQQSAYSNEGDDASVILHEGSTLDVETLRLTADRGIRLIVSAAITHRSDPEQQDLILTRWQTETHVPDGGGVLLAASLAEGAGTPAADHRETVLLLRVRDDPAAAD